MSSLASAPNDENHIFAGCYDSGTLYLLTLQINVGRVDFLQWKHIPLPFETGGINKILTVTDPAMIVLACSNGVFWSPIPPVIEQISNYGWSAAAGLPIGGGFSDVANGLNSSVIAGAWGANTQTGLYGIFIGDWNQQRTSLAFKRATIQNLDPTLMLRTSVASCRGNRNFLYAVSDGANETIYSVLASQDGGNTWSARTIPANPGKLGWYNNCIDVTPANANIVAIGWRGGPFVSLDGAASWNVAGAGNDGLHSDLHAVYFPGLEDDPNALFVGSDGGVVLISGSGSVTSAYNKHLANLQVYSGGDSASYQFPGLYAAATQDNGNIYCVVDPNAPQ